MSMAYIRKQYGVPAKRGMLVRFYVWRNGSWELEAEGKITGACKYVHMGGFSYHPTSELVYVGDDGSVLMDTRKEPAK